MAKFYDAVGYTEQVETAPGVWEDVLTERKYYGDVLRNTRNLDETQNLNEDISLNNSFSIVADAYALHHFYAMRYIRWQGAYWTITNVEVQAPRLILRVGGLWNGNKAPVTPTP